MADRSSRHTEPRTLTRGVGRFSPGKWITGVATTGAAIVSILSFARSYGVIGDDASHLAVGSLGAAWVGLSPGADTAESVGDTLRFAATVTGKTGAVLVGSWIQWTSDDTTIATVGGDGSVIARRPGTTNVVVIVGEHIARSRVVVKQRPAGIRFASDSEFVVPENGRAEIRPYAVDARGFAIVGVHPAVRVADTNVVSTDSSGYVVPNGLGRTTLLARLDTLVATATVRVSAVPTSIVPVSGTNQNALAGRPLAAPLTVRVLSMRGKPIAGIPVHFTTGDGHGTLSPAIATTDSLGRARTAWTLGTIPGRHRLNARAEGLDSILTIVAEADPVAANVRHTLIGDGQIASAGDTLPERIGIKLTDSTGLPLLDVPILWTAPAGDSIVATADRTDSLGVVEATWKLGPGTAPRRARVQVGKTRAIPPYALTATARPGVAHSITVKSGNEQKATAGSSLAAPIVLRVSDRFDNPLEGVTVTLDPDVGTVPDSTVTTDSAGQASIRWKLGAAAGGQKLAARAEGVEKSLEISATATVGRVAKAAFGSAPTTVAPGKLLAPSPAVTITDAHDNPIAGVSVTFTATTGTVSPATVKTDATGRAAVRWLLGPGSAAQTLTALVKGTAAKAVLEVKPGATAKPGAPSAQKATAPASQKGTAPSKTKGG
jgi:hypothetical protein